MSTLKHAGMQICAGGSAGFVEVCMMQPLDVLKTRFQLQTKAVAGDMHSYTSIVDCMRKMYRAEGFLSFWKGVIPPILVETPKRAVKFFTFEQYKRMFTFGSQGPTPLTFSLAGLGAGVTEAILVNPFEVVKVSMQANHSHHRVAPSTVATTMEIVRSSGFGLRGLNKGITATMCRNGSFNMIYFGFYHSVKGYFPHAQDHRLEVLRRLLIGLIAGTIASCFNIPFDVAKSRIQGPQPVPGQVKYRTTLASMLTVYREEGFRALYKGLVPKVLRLGPGGGIMLVVYEYVYEKLQHTFPD
ncbi:unnamed protein product [Darwinula stevensoni]|uniref:Mitochondrial 2-oxodicarboxylate carrier n=1 Tax=Darwinula stevensoni TaxID=69355 RepID=A0A7R9A5P7_9CRUS|nr:unnamed protein product [Darwinula stevensoni]CAG0886936.1 unnamed protein product [Darwinula stevensoni]